MEIAWSKKNKVLMVMTSVALSLSAAACRTETVYVTVPGGGTTTPPRDPYRQPWYDVYGYYCGAGLPSPGCNFYADGVKIIDYEDPYFYSNYTLYYDYWSFYDSWGYSDAYTGWAWLSPTGVIYDEYGYALNEAKERGGRDVIGDVAADETKLVSSAGKDFAERFSLAEATGVKIAKTLNGWATLGKNRGRTTADMADFSQRLYGVSIEKAVLALNQAQKGDLTGINSVNVDVANYWSTDAETSKEILRTWYAGQLNQVGL